METFPWEALFLNFKFSDFILRKYHVRKKETKCTLLSRTLYTAASLFGSSDFPLTFADAYSKILPTSRDSSRQRPMVIALKSRNIHHPSRGVNIETRVIGLALGPPVRTLAVVVSSSEHSTCTQTCTSRATGLHLTCHPVKLVSQGVKGVCPGRK